MKRARINEQRLIEICKSHGFTRKAYSMAATEFGVSSNSIQTYVSKNKLHSRINRESSLMLEKSIPEQSPSEELSNEKKLNLK
ncbi:MAG TPA: hypothetical protein VHP38_02230 [Ruminiclostridium sp.]|nr:hypothetical protein [Ruminiclostridium sp.]